MFKAIMRTGVHLGVLAGYPREDSGTIPTPPPLSDGILEFNGQELQFLGEALDFVVEPPISEDRFLRFNGQEIMFNGEELVL